MVDDDRSSDASVLIVDDQEPFRAVARMVVSAADGLRGRGRGRVGRGGREARPAVRPHTVVLMDINLPGINGIEATRQVLDERPGTAVILLSTYDADSLPADAESSGAARYVH